MTAPVDRSRQVGGFRLPAPCGIAALASIIPTARLVHWPGTSLPTPNTRMRVSELMQKQVRTIADDATIAEAVTVMADSHVSGLPVVDSRGRILGVISATDVLQAEAEQESTRDRVRLFDHTAVSDVMTPNVQTVEPEVDVREAAQKMLTVDVHRLFVVKNEELVGVISQTDVAHAVANGML
jgi:CBS domain-containing protein